MPIELAKIELNRVHKIDTLERASLVHHRVPGMDGNVIQDLGRDSVRLQIEGIFYGTKAGDDLETLRKAYKAREPVDFLADIVGQAYFAQVVLEAFEVVEAASEPEEFSYRLTIAEYVPPKKSTAQSTAAVNQAVGLQGEAMMDIASLPDAIALGSIPELTNPAQPLTGAMGEITSATEGLSGISAGFTELSALQVTASEEPPPTVEIVEPELDWSTSTPPPSTQELIQSGVPTKSLLKKGISPADLLEAGESPNALLTAGISDDDLVTAGVTEDAIAAAKKVQETLDAEPQPFWVAIALVDEDENPIANQPYQVVQADGKVLEGVLDEEGKAYVEVITLKCTVTFPDLDEADWRFPAGEPPESEPLPTHSSWLAFSLVDEDGQPFGNEPYRLTLPDGSVQGGVLGMDGQTRLEQMPSGPYALSFPNLDAQDWQIQTDEQPEPQESAIPNDEEGDRPSPTNTSWLALTVVDEDGNPLAHEQYHITLLDGTVQTGTLDNQGQARIDGLEAGSYSVSLPELDADDWNLNDGGTH